MNLLMKQLKTYKFWAKTLRIGISAKSNLSKKKHPGIKLVGKTERLKKSLLGSKRGVG